MLFNKNFIYHAGTFFTDVHLFYFKEIVRHRHKHLFALCMSHKYSFPHAYLLLHACRFFLPSSSYGPTHLQPPRCLAASTNTASQHQDTACNFCQRDSFFDPPDRFTQVLSAHFSLKRKKKKAPITCIFFAFFHQITPNSKDSWYWQHSRAPTTHHRTPWTCPSVSTYF